MYCGGVGKVITSCKSLVMLNESFESGINQPLEISRIPRRG